MALTTVPVELANLDGAVTVNESSADADFRVESNGSANMLYVDGGDNKVLIEAQNTDTVSNSATLIAAGVLEINGNAGEGSDHIKMGAMADGTGNQFIEATNSSGASSYKLMINPVNGGNLYSGGNLEFPSGKGIDFSATSDVTGSASEVLDDYEEGIFQGAVTGSVGGSMTLSTNSDHMAYTKIGRQVTVTGYLAITGDSSVDGAIRFALPYACDNLADDAEYSMGSLALVNNGSTLGGQKYIFVIPGSYAYLYSVLDDGAADYIKHDDVDTNFQIMFNFSYFAAT